MLCQRHFTSCSQGCHSDFNSDVSCMLFQLQLQMQCAHFAHRACRTSVKQREGGRCVLVLSAGRSMWNARLELEVLCLFVFGQVGVV